jgi:hypothetical protein
VQRLTIANSLSFSKACKPLFGGCPPAIFPVPAAGAHESVTVDKLVTAVNQILVRLRSCGILANVLQTQSKAQFYTARVATECDTFVVTKVALHDDVTGDATVAALVQQWEALGLPASIDESTFTRYYTQLYKEQGQSACG